MTTLTSIPFFSDTIKIKPHTATLAQWLDRPVSIREFANERAVRLMRKDNGEYIVDIPGTRPLYFIEGPEVQS